MAEYRDQPYKKLKENIANIAKWQRLTPYGDISLVGNHAERFSMDPDDVFWKCSFSTVAAFAVEAKERAEYRERYNYYWQEITSKHDSTGSTTRGEH